MSPVRRPRSLVHISVGPSGQYGNTFPVLMLVIYPYHAGAFDLHHRHSLTLALLATGDPLNGLESHLRLKVRRVDLGEKNASNQRRCHLRPVSEYYRCGLLEAQTVRRLKNTGKYLVGYPVCPHMRSILD
jgi:hypothetical protein